VPTALVVQILVGLLVPIIAGLAPIINGSRITVLRALSGGLAEDEQHARGGKVRLSWFDWMQGKVTRILARRGIHIPRPFVISLRNTFRRKNRLALTLFTLTMGGAIFIAGSTYATLHDYIGQIGNISRMSLDLSPIAYMRRTTVMKDGIHVWKGTVRSGELLDEKAMPRTSICLGRC
jgi:putative ABC transport system permease protein